VQHAPGTGFLEIDLNPVISGPAGTAAVDAMVVEATG